MGEQATHGQCRVLVLGMGATGASVARYLAARGDTAVFCDTRGAAPGRAAIAAAMPESTLYSGPALPELPHTVEQVVVSPGVPLDLPLLVKAHERGLEICSDIDLFMRECRAPVVAVTGSNGKSTVTAMTAAALAGAGWHAPAGGNLGTPALDLLDASADAYVLELSSFQLERTRPIAAAVAVVLNLSPDHLDSHTSFDAYAQAKQRIYLACRHAVVNRDEPALAALPGRDAVVSGFTLLAPEPGDFGLLQRDGDAWLACGERPLLRAADLQVAGRHNYANALAALALGAALGADPQSMVAGLRDFPGLPHRMQCVHRGAGVTWIDDSKATNVGAAVTSVNGVPGPLVLIAGGDAKGAEFSALADALHGRDCKAVLLGQDRERLAAALQRVCEVCMVADMDEAVAVAGALANPGTTVLLAPACSSLDMYTDYAARGDAFCAAAKGQGS
ncbi:MAG: UDP-N-acetylmuramoyl-L-alanine--D-glutamate ligase [Chromatiales bacterium]|nr:MAG: UDP-N-acetylmuramoyl-L-alanine--D-glutamate ligase [Chromatiales bacterium]